MLRVEDLSAFYDKAEILKGINLKVDREEVVAVLGPNGAGKTTLLRSICGLVRTKGSIVFAGKEISNLKPHERIRLGISICPEGRRLFPNMTVEDNLKLGALLEECDDRLRYVYSLFPKLKERRNQFVKTMSGGEQQMVAIGRALMANPKLILLDEPSMGLAPIVVEKIAKALKRIKEDLGISILIVEQNLSLAFEVADRAYVLVKGEIVKEGPIEEMQDLEKKYFEI